MDKEINLFDREMESIPVGKEECFLHTNQPVSADALENLLAADRARQQEIFTHQQIKRIVEALLFASSEPVSFLKIREIVETFHPVKPRLLRELIDELQQEFLTQQRAFRLEEIAQGFLLRTCEEYSVFINLLYRNKRTEKLSPAATEVLAIIAYRQPTTRAQIEAIRGVDSTGVMQNLLERELIEPVGKLETLGRPTLYGVTKNFLKHFGLRNAQDLPSTM